LLSHFSSLQNGVHIVSSSSPFIYLLRTLSIKLSSLPPHWDRSGEVTVDAQCFFLIWGLVKSSLAMNWMLTNAVPCPAGTYRCRTYRFLFVILLNFLAGKSLIFFLLNTLVMSTCTQTFSLCKRQKLLKLLDFKQTKNNKR
jgi:hypothetical protein